MIERRGIGHHDQLGAVGDRVGQRFGEPKILTDEDADLDALDLDNARAAIRIDLEVATFVEYRIVGQLALAIGCLNAAIAQDADRVVDDRAG